MERFRPNQYDGEAPSKRPNMVSEYRDLPSSPETTEAREAIDKVRAVLDSIEEKVLFDIFSEYFGRVGNEIESLDSTLSTIDEIGIFYNEKAAYLGFYHSKYGPQLNAYFLKERDDQILNTLIHEYLHEVTSLRSRWTESSLQSGEPGILRVSPSGFSKITDVYAYEKETDTVKDKKRTFFFDNQINEGVTQILTDDLHALYRRRSGQGGESPVRKNREKNLFTSEAYIDEQFNARVYIAFVSALTDIPEDDVKNAVVRSYFRNGSIVPNEIAELLPIPDFSVEEIVDELKHGLELKSFVKSLINKALPITNLTESQQIKLYMRLKELNDLYLDCK